ncbi:MAG: DNA-methyltransferase [Candidatus Roseilinea sp.]|uniref:DNA-methyltransferase n=1 Tax=Candidatus Roseilinea sp. TaxID=2838777 RepID=UPI00404984B9
MTSTTVSRPGDIWRVDRHRLMCTDASDHQAIARLMGSEKAALLFTSPPYANQRNYTTGGIADWDALMQGVFGAATTAMREDGQILVNLGLVHRNNEWQPYWEGWIEWMRQQGWRRFGWYVWDKVAALPGDWNGRLAPRHEFIFHFNRKARKPNKIVPCKDAGSIKHPEKNKEDGLRTKEGNPKRWSHVGKTVQNFRIPDSVIAIPKQGAPIDPKREIDHPAVFPVRLPQFIIEAFTLPGEVVFDPFGGSGTTMIAAEITGRVCVTADIAPEYVDVAIKRFRKKFDGAQVILEQTGQTFDEVAAHRSAVHPSSESLSWSRTMISFEAV